MLSEVSNSSSVIGKYALGNNLTLADLAILSQLTLPLEISSIYHSKYPKLASYCGRIKSQLPYFEEMYRAVIDHAKQQ
ncbi:hypothetical protein HPB49_017466 [Dermacentor silvarum]|uniref:Uncharacterized protein n=1 Tax=Dermacentor silvarum TaxID=543639 RepID=A0ACB8D6Y1_DERSI|nr:hypothetical protein HPB49_017466 [Dermacentor silvarum]